MENITKVSDVKGNLIVVNGKVRPKLRTYSRHNGFVKKFVKIIEQNDNDLAFLVADYLAMRTFTDLEGASRISYYLRGFEEHCDGDLSIFDQKMHEKYFLGGSSITFEGRRIRYLFRGEVLGRQKVYVFRPRKEPEIISELYQNINDRSRTINDLIEHENVILSRVATEEVQTNATAPILSKTAKTKRPDRKSRREYFFGFKHTLKTYGFSCEEISRNVYKLSNSDVEIVYEFETKSLKLGFLPKPLTEIKENVQILDNNTRIQ